MALNGGAPIEVDGAVTAAVEGRKRLELSGNPATVVAEVAARDPVAAITLRKPHIQELVLRIYAGT
ncbi:hypothetical protein [Streptomonospora alba]|uniref:hypothetical protein n=1 Tax=Streptomonospora alba TaxID=183763 RepID=UPI0012EDAB37|nr:hypothetical protein [Streptomonospora alba]